MKKYIKHNEFKLYPFPMLNFKEYLKTPVAFHKNY